MSEQLNFNGSRRDVPLRSIDVGDRQVILDTLPVSNLVTLDIAAYPYKYLPVMWIDKRGVETRGDYAPSGIVLNKGTIVSLLTNQTSINYGIPAPSSSGTIPVYVDETTGNVVYQPVDDKYFGYQESIFSLLVPANGGANSTLPYSALDDEDEAGWTKSTDSDLVLTANKPVGIVIQNVYQDIRGAYINYETGDVYTIANKGIVHIPYVDTSKIANFGNDSNVAAPAGTIYESIWKKYTFIYFDSSASEGAAGTLVKSDMYGKFVCQDASASAAKTVQTVGSLKSTDSRFPKDLTAMIQNYPGISLRGSGTAGLPEDLYNFGKAVLTAGGSNPDKKDILAAVQEGAIGIAVINIDL